MVKTAPTIPLGKLRTIAQNLLKKTKSDQVNWVRVPSRAGVTETIYQLILPQSRVVLTYTIPRAEANQLSFQLQNGAGVPVDTWSLSEPDWGDADHPNDPDQEDPEGDWRLLNGLFQEIQRHVIGWDKVVSDIETALASNGPIGTMPIAR